MKATCTAFGLLMAFLVSSCSFLLPDSLSSDDVNEGHSATYPYLSETQYQQLKTRLAEKTGITRATLDAELEAMGVSTGYEYSYYSSGDYVSHSMNWNRWSSSTYDWVYYVDVDIWTDGAGHLRENMGSYYRGD